MSGNFIDSFTYKVNINSHSGDRTNFGHERSNMHRVPG